MNRTQIGKLEVKVDGALEHTVKVFKNGEGLQVEGNGFILTGEYVGSEQAVINMVLRKAWDKYGKEKVKVYYHPQ